MALAKIKSEVPRNCELHQQKNVRNAGEDKEYTLSDEEGTVHSVEHLGRLGGHIGGVPLDPRGSWAE